MVRTTFGLTEVLGILLLKKKGQFHILCLCEVQVIKIQLLHRYKLVEINFSMMGP